MKQKFINCYNCKHFYVTWDYNFPRGCKIFEFKSKQIPSKLVYESTGTYCSYFEEKVKK